LQQNHLGVHVQVENANLLRKPSWPIPQLTLLNAPGRFGTLNYATLCVDG
jgi:hypothetical protein